MDKVTVKQIVEAVGGILINGKEDYTVEGVCTDSRQIATTDVFFPLKGERADGHDFIPQIIEKGCKVIVASNKESAKSCGECAIILVDDTQKALQNFAKWYIKNLDLKVIAVTGSVGKTSTRDFVCAGMNMKYVTGTNKKNYNSLVGLPLTIFDLTSKHEAAVLEMGMDNKGEIHELVDIARPEVAVITNIGISHLERLGTREGIRDAKLEVTDFFGDDNVLIVNSADDLLGTYEYPDKYKVVFVGKDNGTYEVENLKDHGAEGIEFDIIAENETYHVNLNQPGAHNATNVLFAVAACAQFDVPVRDVIAAVEKVEITGNRLKIKEANSIKIIDDSYNAAPTSMKSAIETLSNTCGKRKVAILGDMYELGSDEEQLHENVGKFATEKNIDLLIGVGTLGCKISKGAEEMCTDNMKIMSFETKELLISQLDSILKAEDVVLIKASRGLELEKVSEAIIELRK